MATPSEKLAIALEGLHELQEKGIVAINASEFPSRQIRERLIRNGFLTEVSKGWYIPTMPDQRPGDTTAWYMSYWEFCAGYLKATYGTSWCITADESLLRHAGNWTVPSQLIVKSPQANNSVLPLPHHTSLFKLKAQLPSINLMIEQLGIRMYSLPASLVYCSLNLFKHNSIDIRTALLMVRDASEVLVILLENGNTTIAGRLAGAFRNVGKSRIADDIIRAMKAAQYDVREVDPFDTAPATNLAKERSPYIIRLRVMWQEMREVIIPLFPKPPVMLTDPEVYLSEVEDMYITDAYHSLSIERYKVTPELIQRVRRGQWDKDGNKEDKQQRDAMAARGYWLAFQNVKTSIKSILRGKNPGIIADQDHGVLYEGLFAPSVEAGLLKPMDLAGYRNHQVYIGGSKHVPLSIDAMRDAMPVLFELLTSETDASVRVVLGHFVFVFIHPYIDGNGRMGRFLMNVMLASGGYPWTVIPVEMRAEYMEALEKASVSQDITPLTNFIGHLVNEGMKGSPLAHLPG